MKNLSWLDKYKARENIAAWMLHFMIMMFFPL